MQSPETAPAAAAVRKEEGENVTVATCGKMGLGLVAAAALAIGEEIVREQPTLVATLERRVACAVCLANLTDKAEKCQCHGCDEEYYCSDRCQAFAAGNHHRKVVVQRPFNPTICLRSTGPFTSS
jgi:hypothetical protein